MGTGAEKHISNERILNARDAVYRPTTPEEQRSPERRRLVLSVKLSRAEAAARYGRTRADRADAAAWVERIREALAALDEEAS